MQAIDILKYVKEKGFLISPKALKELESKENPKEILNKVFKKLENKKLIIEPEDLIIDQEEIYVIKKSQEIYAKNIESQVNIIHNFKEESEGTVEEFVDFFVNRFETLKEMLKLKKSDIPYYDIKTLKTKQKINCKTIGLVTEKYETKNGHIMLVIEDPTGSLNVLIPKDNEELKEFSKSIVYDEALCIVGYKSNSLFIAKEIYFPDVEIKQKKTINQEIYSVFLSDIHIGSNLFLKKNFEKFIDWINLRINNEKLIDIAKRIKYIFIAGDVVDGVGIYPGQEKELNILDIYDQYKEFEKYMLEIPEYIDVIIIPGNHDFSRSPDPQQPLSKELFDEIYEYKNFHFLSSPGMVETHGFKVLMYHGTFFDDLISNIPYLNYEDMGNVMIECLKKRHVHVIYGGKPIIPYKYDPMIIREIPDIFHTGHTHKNGYAIYNGVYCINSGTFQDLTPYQEKQGHKPTPSIVPILNMKTGKISEINFKN